MVSLYKTRFLDNWPFSAYLKLKIPVLKVSQLLNEKKVVVNNLMVPDSECTPSKPT